MTVSLPLSCALRDIAVGPKLWFITGLALILSACGASPEVSSPYACSDCNLLLISIDTLRADHLGTYGYPGETSPQIDEWAGHSAVFERAFSTAEKTADSHMSIFTGLHPSSHRIVNTNDPTRAFRLPDNIETLTEVLKEAGFATAGLHGGGNVDGSYGFDRGFDVYKQRQKFFTHPSQKVDLALEWLEQRQAERFFLFFHTYFVHDPYIPTGEFVPESAANSNTDMMAEIRDQLQQGGFDKVRETFWSAFDGDDPADVARVVDLYDATIREADSFVGRLIREVGAREPNTLIVLVSDHGEAFQEHGTFLHTTLYNEIIHVPLILSHPAVEERLRITDIVSLVDLAPTLLDLLGQRPLSTASGRSFAHLLRSGDADGRPGPAYSEKLWFLDPDSATPTTAIRSIVFPDGTKIVQDQDRGLEYYDLNHDPGETIGRAARGRVPPDKIEAMTDLARQSESLGAELYQGQSADRVTLDEESQRQLEALGYIE